MVSNIAADLAIPSHVNVKATTTEKLDSRDARGIAAGDLPHRMTPRRVFTSVAGGRHGHAGRALLLKMPFADRERWRSRWCHFRVRNGALSTVFAAVRAAGAGRPIAIVYRRPRPRGMYPHAYYRASYFHGRACFTDPARANRFREASAARYVAAFETHPVRNCAVEGRGRGAHRR